MPKPTLKSVEAGRTLRFRPTLEAAARKGAALLIPVPGGLMGELPGHGKCFVEGTLEGFPFRAPLQATPEGGAGIDISEALKKAARIEIGESAEVEITRIGDEPEVRVPEDLLSALAGCPPAMALWNDVTPMARREWVRWIASAKQEATRVKRIEVGLDKLTKGMRRPCCFPGLNWVTKDLVGPEETWVALPENRRRP